MSRHTSPIPTGFSGSVDFGQGPSQGPGHKSAVNFGSDLASRAKKPASSRLVADLNGYRRFVATHPHGYNLDACWAMTFKPSSQPSSDALDAVN
jgi:hypothetical protein